MYVRLWLVPIASAGVCLGAGTFEQINEVFIGSDTTKETIEKHRVRLDKKFAAYASQDKNPTKLFELEQAFDKSIAAHYFQKAFNGALYSVELVASVLLGSTGWSQGDFICTYKDLTDSGKALYDLLKTQHPHCTLHILTFLDT